MFRVCSEHGRAGCRLCAHVVFTNSGEARKRRNRHEDHERPILLGGLAGDIGRSYRTDTRRNPAGPFGPQAHYTVEHGAVVDLVDHDRRDTQPCVALLGSCVGWYCRRCHFYRRANVHRRNSRGIYYTHNHDR